jgi:MFS family permease
VLQTYRRALSVPGAVAFSSAGLVARLPISMTGLGMVLLISGSTGSYGTAGAVSAAYTVASAVFQPLLGRWVDRYGQARVAAPALAGFAAGTAMLAVGVETDASRVWWYAGAVVMGAAFPPWGSLVRARWAYAVRDRRTVLPTAFALEAVVDEMIFVVGPTLVTVLVTVVHPTAGIGGAAVLGVVGGALLLAQRSSSPPPALRRGASRPGAPTTAAGTDAGTDAGERLGWRVLGPLTVASVGLGMFFGGAEVSTVAFTEEAGNRADAAWVLGLWATGSMAAGIVAGMLPPGSALRRLRVGAVLLTATMASTMLATTTVALAACLFGSGLAIAPTLIATVALVEETVPRSRLTEGMTWLTTGVLIGVAPGAALCGAVVDAYGASTAFAVPVGGGLLAAALAWTIRPAPARRIGSDAGGDHTVAQSSAPGSADPGRRRDA